VTFRQRLTLVSAGAVAAAVAVASIAVWFVVRAELRGQVDASLLERVRLVERLTVLDPPQGVLPSIPLGPDDPLVLFQVVAPNGEVIRVQGSPAVAFPVPASGDEAILRDVTARGVHYRLYAEQLGNGFTVMLARPLTEVDDTLRRLALVLLFVAGAGVALAAGLGLGVARTAAAPVARLTEAAERVTRTGDLSHRIQAPPARDEVGRLASSFNAMLGTLEASVTAQRQLVADASHELRTPLTSVRTNIDLLASGKMTDAAERERLLSDVRVQLEELTAIVNDVVELARGSDPVATFEDVRLDEVVVDAIRRFEQRSRAVTVTSDVEPSVVTGDASRISRAVMNLLDNAGKWSPEGAQVEVAVRGSTVSVRDHGPGFPEEDLPQVFDRFYRATSARGMPGSGLGLAIVRQVAEAHGGRAVAENDEDGGAVVRLELRPAANGDDVPAPP
jgi:two-component system sensor histidine kinase MprB